MKKKNWSHSAGPYRFRIRVFENPTTKVITGEMRDPSRPCGYRSVVLRHEGGAPFTREEATAWATQQSAQWQQTKEQVSGVEVSRVRRIIGLYLEQRTPKKSLSEQDGDARRSKLWTTFLGLQFDLSKLKLTDSEKFIELRREGAINATGEPVEVEDQKPVGESTVADDLLWLRGVVGWALKRGLMTGDNPTRGWEIPKSKNVQRPVATTDRFEALRAVSDRVMMTIGRGKKAVQVRSHLSELLDLAYYTGRRISAIRQLRFEDLRLKEGPRGSILWPANTDKLRRQWVVPMSREVREVIDRVRRERPAISGYLFPSPTDPAKAISKELAYEWLIEAEDLAQLPHLEQGGWHPFRRGWATARKGMPIQDLMAIGGWKNPVVLQTLYQQPDQATLLRIVDTPVELREVKSG